MAKDPSANNAALGAGMLCYVIWGIVPLAFQIMGRMGIGAWEILAHRTLWAVPTAFLFVVLARQTPQLLQVLRQPRVMAWLALSAAIIAVNWLVFIWAVNNGRVLETSLGYFINPLMAMAAARTIAQVSRAVAPGGIAPEEVITPGIFVQGIVEVPAPAQEEALNRANAHYPEVSA